MSNVLVVAVHPDDETLGCGGTILKHCAEGDSVYWLIVTTASKSAVYSEAFCSKREKQIEAVAAAYRFEGVVHLGLPALEIDTIPKSKLAAQFSNVLEEIKPTTLYIPYKNDIHSDHRSFFDVAYIATKTFRVPYVKRVLMMETLSETEFSYPYGSSFRPNVFVDIAPYINKKIEIMQIYESEIQEHPFPRSKKAIEALALYRGSSAGCNYAESFMLLKELI